MANNLTLIKKYIALLDEVYKSATLTADLESDSSTVRQGSNARTILIPKMSMDGLGDYSRKDGYVSGDVDLEWVEKTFNYDRGRRFSVDAMDNEETAALSFGKLASEFIRTKVVPEMDAWRFASYAKAAGTNKSEDLADGAGVCAAITAANIAMDEAEVPQESRLLYITPTMYNAIQHWTLTSPRQCWRDLQRPSVCRSPVSTAQLTCSPAWTKPALPVQMRVPAAIRQHLPARN